MQKPILRNPDQAFEDALKSGFLTMDESSHRFVGLWMYMYTTIHGEDAFKNIETRKYILTGPAGK